MKLLLGSNLSQFYGILSKIAYFHYLRALKSKFLSLLFWTKTNPDKYKTLFLKPCKSSLSDSNRFLSLSISVAHSCHMLAFAFPLYFSTVSSRYCDISVNSSKR